MEDSPDAFFRAIYALSFLAKQPEWERLAVWGLFMIGRTPGDYRDAAKNRGESSILRKGSSVSMCVSAQLFDQDIPMRQAVGQGIDIHAFIETVLKILAQSNKKPLDAIARNTVRPKYRAF